MSLALAAARVEFPRRRHPTVRALDDVSLEIGDGELVAVVGRSGSGKSTLLRVVAGLVRPSQGRVSIDGRDVTELPPGRRQVALVPQDLPLFPHLDVRANLAFGETARRTPRTERAARIERAVELVGLGHLLDRHPHSLSGGERQRVALARALVRQPAAFLLDEPLSGLDGATRLALRADIRRIQRESTATMLYVTHDPQEAMAVADRVAVLHAGRIEQVGRPADLYAEPASTTVARLVGPLPMNVMPGDLASAPARTSAESAAPTAPAGAVSVGVRPERLRIVEPVPGPRRPPAEPGSEPAAAIARVAGVVTAAELIGEQFLVRVLVQDSEVLVTTGTPPSVGTEVGLVWDIRDEHWFDGAGRRLDPVRPSDEAVAAGTRSR